MKDTDKRLSTFAAIAVAVIPLLIVIYLLFLSPQDLSSGRTGEQRVLGATYMTMNNPYFQMLDA